MNNIEISEEMKKIEKSLYNSFPYSDTDKIQKDFKKHISKKDTLTADLNSYWMNILGCLINTLRGNLDRLEEYHLEKLQLSFFEIFKQYSFLEERLIEYPALYNEYVNYEKARMLILKYLSNN